MGQDPEGEPRYRRILLKLSGEALAGAQGYGIDPAVLERIAEEVRTVLSLGVGVAIVIGGGNIFRGLQASASGMDRASADYMGMLATVINGLALQNTLEKAGLKTRCQSATAGTGNPFFTTDTAAALRAVEIHAEAILMAKNGVEGVLTGDPREDAAATLIPEISHMEALRRGLRVMDYTALTLCAENSMPLHVFNMNDERNIERIVSGEQVGTVVVTRDE